MPGLAILIAVAAFWWMKHPHAPGDDARGGGSGGAGAPAVERVAGEKRLSGPVVKVVDGDTIHVELANSVTPIEKVRLLRINTPERKRPGFERASAALTALVAGRTVELAFENPEKPERDEYGRLLAYVFVGEKCVNVEMVRGGWTRFFTKYGEGRHAAAFRAAEEEASKWGAGLWQGDDWNPDDR
jgi:micrococcal nuclease